jgi:hypothetical protein
MRSAACASVLLVTCSFFSASSQHAQPIVKLPQWIWRELVTVVWIHPRPVVHHDTGIKLVPAQSFSGTTNIQTSESINTDIHLTTNPFTAAPVVDMPLVKTDKFGACLKNRSRSLATGHSIGSELLVAGHADERALSALPRSALIIRCPRRIDCFYCTSCGYRLGLQPKSRSAEHAWHSRWGRDRRVGT